MSHYTYVERIGGKIFHRWIDDNGKQRSEFTDFSPSLYIPTNEPNFEFTGIRTEPLKKRDFNTIWDATKFVKGYKDVENFPIYGNQNWWCQFIQSQYTGKVDWKNNLVVAVLDIETRMNKGFPSTTNPESEITCISVNVIGKHIYTFCTKPYDGDDYSFIFMQCKDENEMLMHFLMLWKKVEADVISGWNTDGFDIPYTIARIGRVLGDEYVSLMAPTARRYTKKAVEVGEFMGKPEYTLHGINSLDYLRVYKKFTRVEQENYKLDYIAHVELGDRKLDYSEYGNLDDLWRENPSKYIEYNVQDTRLIERLDEKLNLFMFVYQLSYMCHVRFNDVFGQVRMWDSLIYNKLLENNVVIPPKTKHHKDEKYRGAYVIDPIIGMHEWVVSEDLASLYPHILLNYNISPELLVTYDDLQQMDTNDSIDILLNNWNDSTNTLNVNIDKLSAGEISPIHSAIKTLNLSMTANGSLYRKDVRGFLPEMMDELYKERKVAKGKMLNAEQEVEDIENELKLRGVKI